MPVQSVNTGGAFAATFERRAASAASTSFAGELASASKKTRLGDVPDSVLDSKKVPKGETTKPVDGHAYSDILSGPRNGMYLNTSGNKRDGMAFSLVERNGREYHIYGSGKDRLVVCLRRRPAAEEAPKTPETVTPNMNTAPSGTTGGAAAARL